MNEQEFYGQIRLLISSASDDTLKVFRGGPGDVTLRDLAMGELGRRKTVDKVARYLHDYDRSTPFDEDDSPAKASYMDMAERLWKMGFLK